MFSVTPCIYTLYTVCTQAGGAGDSCWRKQCSRCKEFYIGDPVDGHQATSDSTLYLTSLDYPALHRFFEKLNERLTTPPLTHLHPAQIKNKYKKHLCVKNLGQIGPTVLPCCGNVQTEITTLYIEILVLLDTYHFITRSTL